ncbi:MAG: tetratricopeptide repeat protein [Vicinamibacterales bacterium]
MKKTLIPLALLMTATLVVVAMVRDARQTTNAAVTAPPRSPVPGTSRAELTETVEVMTARLAKKPDDGRAVVRLADALMRLQRVNNDGRAVITAEEHLRRFLEVVPDHYEAQRTLAAVLLSQHRFRDAIAQAESVRARDPRDAWNYGALGDGYLELGDYEKAFEAFDRMDQLQPGPPSYARAAYGLELQGDLDGALEQMRTASDGTTPNDLESQAWHFAQIGLLSLQKGRLVEAKLQFDHASVTFPGHPSAIDGLAKIKVAEGDLASARQMLQGQLARVPTPDLAATIGDLSLDLGDASQAERYFSMAEQIERAAWGNGVRQPQVLARFLAEHERNLPEAVTLAEEAARTRKDIFTMDTLAWAYFKSGRLEDAKKASASAQRTGSRDARILYHAAEIQAASGNAAEARRTLDRIPAPDAVADVLIADGIKRLRSRLPHQP